MRRAQTCLSLALLCTNSLAATYYVRPDGDDSNSGLGNTPREAWRTIDWGQPVATTQDLRGGEAEIPVEKTNNFPAKGVLTMAGHRVTYKGKTDCAFTGCVGVPAAKKGSLTLSGDILEGRGILPGDVVEVHEGLYTPGIPPFPREARHAVVLNAHGTAEKPIVYRGVGRPVIDALDKHNLRCLMVHGRFTTVEGFEFRRAQGAAVHLAAHGAELRGSRIHSSREGLIIFGFGQSWQVTARHNQIYGCTGAGIGIHYVRGGRAYNNTIYACGSGIKFLGSEGEAKNNIVVGNQLMKAKSAGVQAIKAKPALGYNNVWNNGPDGKSNYVDCAAGVGSISVDPEFRSIKEGDPGFLRLKSTARHGDDCDSPCIDAGDPMDTPSSESGLRVDMGAFDECVRSAAVPTGSASTKPLCPNLLSNSSFEQGWDYWSPHGWGAWAGPDRHRRIGVTDDEAYHGKRSMFMFREPADTPHARQFVYSTFVPVRRGRTYTISLYAKAEKEQNLSVSINSLHRHFSKGRGGSVKATREWQRHSVRVKWDYPDGGQVMLGLWTGSAWVDAVQIEEGEEATPYDAAPADVAVFAGKRGNLLLPREPLTLEARNNTSTPQVALVTMRFLDAFGRQVHESDETFRLPSDAVERRRHSLGELPPGLYVCRYRVCAGNAAALVREADFRFFTGYPAPHNEGVFYSFSYSGLRFFPLDYVLGNMVPAIKLYGGNALRWYWGAQAMRWALRDDNTCLDELLAATKPFGIDFIITLDDHRFWHFGEKEGKPRDELFFAREEMDEWAGFVRGVLRRYGDRIRHWEIFNEPNAFRAAADGTPFSPEEYIRMLKWHNGLIKSERPDATVIGGSLTILAFLRRGFCRRVIELGPAHCDGISIHPYTWGNPNFPEDFHGHLVALKSMARKPIWCTEEGTGREVSHARAYGYRPYSLNVTRHTIDDEGSELRQGSYLAQMHLIALANGCATYTYHTTHALHMDGSFTPAIGAAALNVMARLTYRARPVRKLKLGHAFKGYLFEREGGTPLAALWPIDETTFRDGAIDLALGRDQVEAFNFMGTPIRPSAKNGKLNFPLTATPTYFRGRGIDALHLGKALESSELAGIPDVATLKIAPIDRRRLRVTVQNRLNRQLAGELTLSSDLAVPLKTATLPVAAMEPEAEANVVFEATRDLPQRPVTFAAEFVSTAGQISKGTGRLDLYIMPRLKTPVRVDGSLDDWQDVRPATLTGKNHLKLWTPESHKGDADTLVRFYTKWDPQHLYFAFEVEDDKWFHSPRLAYFMGDSIQLYLDTYHDGTTEEARGFDDNDYVYNIWRVEDVVHLSRTYVPLFELCGVRGGEVHEKEAPRAVVRNGNKTIYELALPQSSIRPFKIEPGTVLSASFIVNDNDGDVDNRMKGRDKAITLTPKDTEPFQSAHLFSDFLLAP